MGAQWQPAERATLTFVRRGDDVLLIRKLRGHGAGKLNAPGGKVEEGESPRSAAARETREEVCVDPRDLDCRALLRFQDTDGRSMLGYVFVTRTFSGTPAATEEADPFWCPVAQIPYPQMWQADAMWLPDLLSGRRLIAEFLIHEDAVVEHRVRDAQPEELAEALAWRSANRT